MDEVTAAELDFFDRCPGACLPADVRRLVIEIRRLAELCASKEEALQAIERDDF